MNKHSDNSFNNVSISPLLQILTMHASSFAQTDNQTTFNTTPEVDKLYVASTDSPDYFLRKYSLPVLCVIGFMGNSLSAALFLGKTLRGFSCCIFLGVRSITDNGFLITLLIVWLDFLDVRVFHTVGVCHITVFLSYVCSFLSVWCVVCVTIENYVRICHPMLIKLYCTSRTAVMIISFLTFASLCIYNIPLWSNEIVDIYEMNYCVTKRTYQDLQLVLTYIDTAMTLIIPLIAIIVLMVIILLKGMEASKRKLRLGHHRSKNRLVPSYGTVAGLLTAVSITFIFLHTPIHIFKLKVIIETVTGKYKVASVTDLTIGNVFQVMYYLNSSVNFLVYYICGKNFRRVFKEVLCKNISCCVCPDEDDEDRLSDAGTTELTIILEKSDAGSEKSR